MEGTGNSLQDSNAALTWCAETCTSRGWRLAYSLLRNEADAQESVQQAFLVALRKRDRIPLDNPWPWFATVIAHEARNVRRKFQRPQASLNDEDQPMPLPDHRSVRPDLELADRELAAQVSTALGELPADEREALVLTQLGGMTYAESAQALDVPLGTLNHRVSRGLRKLREKLGAGEQAILGCLPVLPVTKPPVALETFLESKLAGAASGSALPATITITGITMKKSAFAIGALSLLLVLALGIGAVVVATSPGEANVPPQMSAIGTESSAEEGSDRDAAHTKEIADPGSNTDSGQDNGGESQPKPADAGLGDDDPEGKAAPDAESIELENEQEDEPTKIEEPPEFHLDEKVERDPRIIRAIGESAPWLSRAEFHTIRIAPDDSFVMVAGESHIQRFAATGEPMWSVSSLDEHIEDIAISPDGKRVYVANTSKSLVILNAATGLAEGSLHVGYSTRRLAISPDGQCIAAGSDGAVSRYRIDTGEELSRYRVPRSDFTPYRALEGLRFSADGSLLTVASVGGDPSQNCLCVFDVESQEVTTALRKADLGAHLVSSVSFSPDGAAAIAEVVREEDFLMTFDEFHGYKGYSAPVDMPADERKKEFNRIYKERLKEYQDYLDSKGAKSEPPRWRDQQCVPAVIDMMTGTVEQFLDVPNPGGGDVKVAFSADGLTVAAWGGNRLHLFDSGVWKLRAKAQIDTNTSCLAFNTDCTVVYCNDGARLRRYDVASGDEDEATREGALKPKEGPVSMSPAGDLVVFTDESGLVAYDVDAGTSRWRAAGYRSASSQNTFGPDGSTVYALHKATGAIHVLDAASGESTRTLDWPEGVLRTHYFNVSGDGGTLSAIGQDGTFDEGSRMILPDDPAQDHVLWKLANDYQPETFATPKGLPSNYMNTMTLSHDGSRGAAGYIGGFVIVDVEAGTHELAPLPAECRFMNNIRIAFTPDAKELIIISLSTNRGFWRLDCESLTMTEVDLSSEYEDEDTDFSACMLSADGNSLILAPYSWDNPPTLIRVDRESGEVLNRYPGHAESLVHLTQNSNSSRVASIDENGILYIWEMD